MNKPTPQKHYIQDGLREPSVERLIEAIVACDAMALHWWHEGKKQQNQAYMLMAWNTRTRYVSYIQALAIRCKVKQHV